MKYIQVLFLFIAFANASEDYSFDSDKQKHFLISAAFGAGSETALEAFNQYSLTQVERLNGVELIGYGTLIGLVPGVIKETRDSNEKGNSWSNADLAYDFAGSFIGSTLSYSLHRFFDTDDYSVTLSLAKHEQGLYVSYRF